MFTTDSGCWWIDVVLSWLMGISCAWLFRIFVLPHSGGVLVNLTPICWSSMSGCVTVAVEPFGAVNVAVDVAVSSVLSMLLRIGMSSLMVTVEL